MSMMSNLTEIIVGPTELADLFGVTPRMISQLVTAGTIARLPGKGSKFNVRDCMRGYTLHLRKAAAGRATGRTAKEASLEESTKLKAVQREIAEIKLQNERALAVPVDQVRAAWLRNAAVFRSAVLLACRTAWPRP